MKLSEDKKLASPKRLCKWQRWYLDPLWIFGQFADWCSLHDTTRPGPHTEAFPGRGQRSSLSALVWWASLLVNPVFATICNSTEALSIMVFSEKLGTIKFSSSSSVSLFYHCTESNCALQQFCTIPSKVSSNTSSPPLPFFLVSFLNKTFLTTIPQTAPSNGPNSDCFFIWQIITYLPTWSLSFLVRKDSGFKMGTLDLRSGSVPCWKWRPRVSACSNENIF